ncbi:MAG: hypothetical protein V3T05_00690 [Myxococcota bacterium]
MRRALLHTLPLVALTACGGVAMFGLPADNDDVAVALEVAPLVSAGADREILRGYPARLDGHGTAPRNRALLEYTWEQIDGEPVFLSNASMLSPTFVAPLVEQELTFKLTADDGRWVTTDLVSLFVRERPSRVAPRVRAAADRFLNHNEVAEPRVEDVLSVPDGVKPVWERLEPTRSNGTISGGKLPERPVAYRLSAERDGLSSAPDYIVLYPYDIAEWGHTAPVSALTGPAVVAPGETLVLDATASADSNNDAIAFRWEQIRGDTLLDAGSGIARAHLIAPSRPQELAFRVFVQDRRLESAPSDWVVVVSTGGDVPRVRPGPDQRTRPDRDVRLDARFDSVNDSGTAGSVHYTWEQTYGTPVVLTDDGNGRIAGFFAPDTVEELAFSVIAVDGAVESSPAVTQISVVAADDNLPPSIYLSASTNTPDQGAWVFLTGRVIDPEADKIDSCNWSQSPAQTLNPLPVCTTGAIDPWTHEIEIGFDAPPPGVTVRIHLQVCDVLDACGEAELELNTLP